MGQFVRGAGLTLDRIGMLWEGGYMICSAHKGEPELTG
jgi:hypothetical protein